MSIRSIDDNIASELKHVICLNIEDGSALAELEQFCSEYNHNDIVKTINRRRDVYNDLTNFFNKNLSNVK